MPITSLATRETAYITSIVVSTVVVWCLTLKGLPAARRSIRLLHLLVATVGTVVLPGLVMYFFQRYMPLFEWSTPLPPLEFVVLVVLMSGLIVFQVLSMLRDFFSARAPRARRPR